MPRQESTNFNTMARYLSVFAFIFLIQPIQGLPNPIASGVKYLMSSSLTGDGYYLGCGDDQRCSILDISNAEEHDGWTVNGQTNGWVGFYVRDNGLALDVNGTSLHVFANDISDQHVGEMWQLNNLPDGSYQVYNEHFSSNLDVMPDEKTPFVNSNIAVSSIGQHWYFRAVQPQTTLTATTTSTSTVNPLVSSTTTVTVTTCLEKRGENDPLLTKRANVTGSDILSTTTQTSWSTSVITVTGTGNTDIQTNTATITSCAPASSTSSAVATVSLNTPPPSKSWIAGAVVGPIAGLALLGVAFLWCLRRRPRATTLMPETDLPVLWTKP